MSAKQLTGKALADAYAELFKPWGDVTAIDLGGGWIEFYGNNLKPAHDLKDLYPNGWSLLDKVRYGEARQAISEGYPLGWKGNTP